MTADQRELLDRLFGDAATLPMDQRNSFLDDHCPDPEVRAELESLLANDFGAPPTGVVTAIGQTAISLSGSEIVGERLGAYRIAERVGHGGMGVVYRAVRDDDYQKTVAIKVLRFAHNSPADVQRFRRERQILATLEHSCIARLLDGGAWVPAGSTERQPYIVMEYVQGLPLTTFCEQNGLSVVQRLLLFRQVCDAVYFAHQRLVVHRDIKPGNILVTEDGMPKLLDFGIAKLIDAEGEPGSATTTGAFVLTPEYASPEQVRGEPVSTLSDVYALGVVLYELLTARRPHQLSSHSPAEIMHEICTREPLPPSTLGDRKLRGDLDVIVLKALEKEPARRYKSVDEFSEDIRRHLAGQAIVARPERLYRVNRFVRRNLLAVTASAALALALLAGITVSLWQAMRASRAQQLAVRERDRAKAVTDFLQKDLLAQASADAQAEPGLNPDRDLKVRTALDRAAARIQGKFAGQPLLEASIRQTMATTYENLGEYAPSLEQANRALELRRRELGDDHRETLESMTAVATVYMQQGESDRAEKLFAKILEGRSRVLGDTHRDTLDTMGDLASVHMNLGHYQKAESLYTNALQKQRRVLGEEHPDTFITINNLATLNYHQGRYAEAESVLVKLLETKRRVRGEEHPDTLATMQNLATLYSAQDKHAQSQALLTRSLEAHRRVLGEEHPFTLITMSNLGAEYHLEGKYAEAEAMLTRALEAQRRVLGAKHANTLITMRQIGNLYLSQRRNPEAERVFTGMLEVERDSLGKEHPDTLETMHNLAVAYWQQERYQQAETLFADLVEVNRRVLGSDHPSSVLTRGLFGCVLVDGKKYREAETVMRGVIAINEKRDSKSWRDYRNQGCLGASLAGQRKYAEAERDLVAAYQGMLERPDPEGARQRSNLRRLEKWMVILYQGWGKAQKAAEWRKKLAAHPLPR